MHEHKVYHSKRSEGKNQSSSIKKGFIKLIKTSNLHFKQVMLKKMLICFFNHWQLQLEISLMVNNTPTLRQGVGLSRSRISPRCCSQQCLLSHILKWHERDGIVWMGMQQSKLYESCTASCFSLWSVGMGGEGYKYSINKNRSMKNWSYCLYF